MENNCPHCSGFRPPAATTCSHCGKYGADSLKEILRLTQELEAVRADKSQADLEAGRWQGRAETAEMNLEASRQREAEARDKALDDAVAAVERLIDGILPDDRIIGLEQAVESIDALKSNHESKDTQGGE